MNKVTVTVELTFSQDVDNEPKEVIGANVMQALIRQAQCSEQGLVGNDFEGYTKEMTVTTDKMVQHWDCQTNQVDTV